MVWVKLLYVNAEVELFIVVHVEPPFIEDSQRTTAPVFPVNAKVPLFVPLQTVAEEETVPPTVVGSTVITLASFNVEEQPVVVFVIVPNVNVDVVGNTVAVVEMVNEPDPEPEVLSLTADPELGALTL